ncbi:signal peptide peptidase SppA [Nocardioides sp.]|uniref:signal peptide peptidase SppA n=1 Tax=Nocardioides sp. TaxID=35761 RepID=UPI0027333CB2|nr:signal peptide peptidase SppA [Nocardioides sp.]MDP3893264.1 signal peptide peptidase SppA [Nocardioides sp.]
MLRDSLPTALRPVLRPFGLDGTRVLLELDLGRGVLEAPPSSPIQALRSMNTPTLRSVVEALEKAADDPRVVGLVAHIGQWQPSLAQSAELRAAVATLAGAGKRTVAWSEAYGELGPGNLGYHLASAFEEVWLQPTGDVGLVGLTAEAVFLRDTFEKLGVQVQLGQRHEYKTAANTFLESAMTEPHREMMTRLVESSMETVVADIAASRGLEEGLVRAAVEVAPLSATEALDRGFVDHLGYRQDVYAAVRGDEDSTELKYAERYHRSGGPLAALGSKVPGRGGDAVAVIHATGPIHLGRSGGSSPLSGPSVGSDTLGAALRAAGRADDVRAVVLRVDSPGGSYVASDAVRREIEALRASGTPVVASMGTVAASGGYFIAMPCDRIVASPGTLTGSIGVLAGKQVLREALGRVGVRRDSVSVGRYADMFSTDRPFDEEEWERLEAWLDRVYDDFTGKAAADREMPLEDLRAVAKGRVWTGADALDVGLVDELGGLSRAVDLACELAGVDRGGVTTRTLPKPNPLEMLFPAENSEAASAARLGEGIPLLDRLLRAAGLSTHGVLSLPLDLRIR